MNFKGKTAVVTGASSGIGEALSRELAALGANIVMGARRGDRLGQIAREITDSGGRAICMVTDVTREEDCRRLIECAEQSYGGVDILICNAGVSMRALFDDVDLDVLRRSMDVNFWGTVYCVKYALPLLQASRGTIVGISSVAGLHGLPCRTGYSASKYAMTGFLETVRIENMRKGVSVMIACPGFTATEVRHKAMTADGSPQGATPRNEKGMMSAQKAARKIIKGINRHARLLTMEYEGRLTRLMRPLTPRLLDRLYYSAMAAEPDSPLKK